MLPDDNASRCQVPGCKSSLSLHAKYYRRYKICQEHASAPSVYRPDELGCWRDSRFCQLCGRFQPLEEFNDARRSCRKALQTHNARRKKGRKALTLPPKRFTTGKQAKNRSPKLANIAPISAEESPHTAPQHPQQLEPQQRPFLQLSRSSFHPQFAPLPPSIPSNVSFSTSISSLGAFGGDEPSTPHTWTPAGGAATPPNATVATATAAKAVTFEDLDAVDLGAVMAKFQEDELFDFLPAVKEVPAQLQQQRLYPAMPPPPPDATVLSPFAACQLANQVFAHSIEMALGVQAQQQRSFAVASAQLPPLPPLQQSLMGSSSPPLLPVTPPMSAAAPTLAPRLSAASLRVVQATLPMEELVCPFPAAPAMPAMPSLDLQPSQPPPQSLDGFPSALMPCMSADMEALWATLSGSGAESSTIATAGNFTRF